MRKKELQEKTDARLEKIKSALQTVYDAHNKGQKKQLVKNEDVKELFDFYGVEY